MVLRKIERKCERVYMGSFVGFLGPFFFFVLFFNGCMVIYRVERGLLEGKEVTIGRKACWGSLMHVMDISGEWEKGERERE